MSPPPDPLSFPRSRAATESVLPEQRASLRRLLADGALDLPRPGAGSTWERWRRLADLGVADLVLARLGEGHADAVAILAEAGRAAPAGELLGVWASANEGTGLATQRTDGGWVLDGVLRFASGARVLDRVLVTGESPSGRLLLLVAVDRLRPLPGTWEAVGMADSDSLDVAADGVVVPDEDVVGEPGFYVDRPGLAIGGLGVAAVWWGGAQGVLHRVVANLAGRDVPGHVAAHVGAAWSAVRRGERLLQDAAGVVDAAPRGDHAVLALHVRHEVERVVAEVVERVGRATGAVPLSRDGAHARQVADLQVFVRQQHAERDLEALGRAVLADDVPGVR